MIYLAVTAENRPSKTEPIQETSSTEDGSADHVDGEPLTRVKGIMGMISQPTARGKIVEAPAALETKRAPAQKITLREKGVVAESFENESATAVGEVLLSPRPTALER